MTSNFKLVTLAVLTTQRHSITRCSRTVAFHMNSNNNRTHVCSRLWMLLHLGKLLKADYWVKSKCFQRTWHTQTLPSVPESTPNPKNRQKKRLTQRVRHRATELKSPCQCLHLTVTACNKQKNNNAEPCDWWGELYWRLKLFMFRFSFQILKKTFQ